MLDSHQPTPNFWLTANYRPASTHATHEPTQPRHPCNPRNLADSSGASIFLWILCIFLLSSDLTLSWQRPLSYRNQSIDYWFLYDNGLRHERVKNLILAYKIRIFRSRFPRVFCKFTGEQTCQSVISIKFFCNVIEITLRHGCAPVNLLHIFGTPFPKNTSGGMLLYFFRGVFLHSPALLSNGKT